MMLTGFKQDGPNKSFIPGKSTNMAPYGGTSKDMLRAAVSGQQMKTAAHPLDMAQVSKAPIPFATNPAGHAPAPSAAMHKTPARPPTNVAKSAAKSAPRSSPRFPNGDSIELPEIETDDEDSDEDDGRPKHIAPWADSPDLRQALVRQETMDPTTVFGIPGPINMEEVFAKSKDKWHKFRARTSSANWSGADRLTEEDIRKDLAARDLMRRQGGWSYEMGRDLV